MKRSLLGCLLAFSIPLGCAVEQPKFQATPVSIIEAIARGEGKEALSALESQALEAESNGEWAKAANAYNLASEAARNGGQLQKAITYGNKALAMAEKGRAPGLQAQAMFYLVVADRAVG